MYFSLKEQRKELTLKVEVIMDGISLSNGNHKQREVQRVNAGMAALTWYTSSHLQLGMKSD
jgi:hypothetical protein